MAELQEALIRATAEAVRPFVARLLALGVPFGLVERRLRALFVDVAQRDFALPGRRPTDSRIALITGINRKEVRRLRGASGVAHPSSFSINHVTSLVSRWTTNPSMTDRAGRPRVLPYRATRGASFMKLARTVTSDLAPGVLLEQLVASGAAEVREGNVVALRTHGFVPRAGSAEQLQILAEDPAELIETILRNTVADDGERLLQRKVYFDNLGGDAAQRIRKEMRREGERFLRRVERLLARYDRDRNPKAAGGARHYAGVGVYCFETPETPARPAPGSRRAIHADAKKRTREEHGS